MYSLTNKNLKMKKGTTLLVGAALFTAITITNAQTVTTPATNAVKSKAAYRDWETDRKSTRLNSSHITRSRMPSSA